MEGRTRIPVVLSRITPVAFVIGLGAWRVAEAQRGDVNPHGQLATPCAACHSATSWRPVRVQATFDHAASGFPLEASHAAVSCTGCHASLEFRKVERTCAACHQDVHRAEFGAECARCHNTRAFTDRTELTRVHALTRFLLDGAHRALDCRSCHGGSSGGTLMFRGAPTECVACHRTDFAATRAPPHGAAGFSTECATCHTNVTWRGAPFDHQTTDFPLTGAHQALTCQQCHADGGFVGRPTACVSCHQTDFNRTTTPPHPAAGFPVDCTMCHTTAAWAGAQFDHQRQTQFPLTGAHLAASCQACHADGVFVGKPTPCASCHTPDYSQTRSPPHQAAGFSTECATCHTTVTWTGVQFDHRQTQFPLTGAHLAATCQACHSDGVYDGKPTTCVSCHQTDYNGTTNPPHQAAGFPIDCSTCHTTTTWTGGQFSHQQTQFPLTGAHLAATCPACHADGVYDGKPTTCVSCHQADYNGTTNPPHQAAGFPTDCAGCHTTATWTGAQFDHQQTQFPLTGAHLAATCQACHSDGVYDGKPTTCVSCHQTDYNQTTNPNHLAAGFPTDCAACHTTVTWLGAQFNHDAQYFPIYTGKHRNQWSTCATCHPNSSSFAVFTCLTCHDHNQTKMNDKHKNVAGYQYTSQACYTCHPNGKKP
jgi:hypothetical protein